AGHRLAVVDPDLGAKARRAGPKREQVVAHREAPRLDLGERLEALRAGAVEVAAGRRADVAGHAFRAPAEVVRGGHVREEREALLVVQVRRRLDEALRLDDDRRLVVALLLADVARDVAPGHDATPRTSSAAGIPSSTRSCSRMMPTTCADGWR